MVGDDETATTLDWEVRAHLKLLDKGWLRDLTNEGVEPNPGPLHAMYTINHDTRNGFINIQEGDGKLRIVAFRFDAPLEKVFRRNGDNAKIIAKGSTLEDPLVPDSLFDGWQLEVAGVIYLLQAEAMEITASLIDSYKYMEAFKFLDTLGASWKYQESPDITKRILETLPTHYEAWYKDSRDKLQHVIYLAFGGPGIGKSRLLKEFYGLCCRTMAPINANLGAMLHDRCLVIKISFENGCQGNFTKDGSTELGVRVLFNLIGVCCI